MSKTKYDGWVLKDSKNFLYAATLKLTKRDVVSETVRDFGISWEEIKKSGYAAVKVRVIEAEDTPK